MVPPALRTAGMRGVHFAERIPHISKLARSNIPVPLAQRLARHSTPTLTLNVYAHVDDAIRGQAGMALT